MTQPSQVMPLIARMVVGVIDRFFPCQMELARWILSDRHHGPV
ncbi:hypothetical protein GbCGDNIH3_7234 [Granulibacter bethesdensis]|uniref:Uncharacterized protein n=2 Tax=Granulibacter bethesdensis TaxID=364410 RepID=A0A286M382_GRABC|nr:hypothetical protein GbCGDNIH3_7234 [Granulibacter bethesdensis]APG31170.1 hypothetical protein GbCGDNIH4_7234a [Granulibacter bethesdensis CGDNIH4]APH52856.1 hypothetical protein GbCGDNIH5_7234 [Granulibacter bethesdensis]APH65544.1 hypothetical protein GbCGDNIH1I4_7234 [Granulibacter bethesdensis]ASV62481.1 hypothetical protein GbCGDNIH1_7234 [Granulibacter bethesdensis CGDNIH1]